MENTLNYDTQRDMSTPAMFGKSGNLYSMAGNYNANFATNDPQALCISGNAYTMNAKGDEIARNGTKDQVKSLRVNITGSIIQSFNMCCWVTTIIFGSIFVFPLFFICCDWWKRRTFQTFSIDPSGYEGVAQMIQYSGAQQIYLTIQDSYFNSDKANTLISAVSRSRIQNFSFTNVVPGFDTTGKNYTDFDNYMKPFFQYVKFGDISWDRKFVK